MISMTQIPFFTMLLSLILYTGLLYGMFKTLQKSLFGIIALALVFALLGFAFFNLSWAMYLLWWLIPILGFTLIGLTYWHKQKEHKSRDVFSARLPIVSGQLDLQNIRRGVSVIGAAGSGKTQSVLAGFMQHFARNQFSGVVHDYKDFELTELLYPMLDLKTTDFYCISFDPIYARVNPIAPKYIESTEAVNEVVRVLVSNLLEERDEGLSGSGKFFSDAVEGLLSGMIWRLRSDYPQYCTLPHVIALYQQLSAQDLLAFVSGSAISKALASAFIMGASSERQTAGVLSTLSNALKKISSLRIFYVLSADETPLAVNQQDRPTIISLVNNPKYESAYGPVIATIMHAITKQMAVRGSKPSFILFEEAPTIRLHNMHRIPATLRSFDIATLYVMQDKIQNDLMYGEKASKAILSNLSYQFFGKVNDPETAKYYEQYFEIVKKPTRSINRSGSMNFDTRITTGEKEVAKIRADVFFRLKPGEFISFADGRERRIQFRKPQLERGLPPKLTQVDLVEHYSKIHGEVRTIFEGGA